MTVSTESLQHSEALAYLFGRIDYERTRTIPYRSRDFQLDRMQQLVDELGNPQQAWPAVHVAGTKGKGSTAAMVAAALSQSGYRTALYTSPHLDRLEERFVVDGRPCEETELVELVQRVRPVVARLERDSELFAGEKGPTYFEITTAMAMLHFVRRNVDVAVLEVGLGGRLDSTNVCHPLISVITSISRDHTRLLGNTLAEIAGEKAGIIKPGVPVVSGVTQSEPRTVIEHAARRRGCRLIQAGRDFDFRYRPPQPTNGRGNREPGYPECLRGSFDYDGFCGPSPTHYRDLEIGLVGRHQAANAAVALTVVELLRERHWSLPPAVVRRALAGVRCPARIEFLSRQPTVILDAAHNDASVAALVEVLQASFPRASSSPERTSAGEDTKRILVFAASQDKEVRSMLQLLVPQFDRILLTRYLNNPRSESPEDLLRSASEIAAENARTPRALRPGDNGSGRAAARLSTHPDPAAVVAELHSSVSPNDCVCITGSFFIAAEMRRLLSEDPLGLPVSR